MTFDPFKEFLKHAADCQIMAKGRAALKRQRGLKWQVDGNAVPKI